MSTPKPLRDEWDPDDTDTPGATEHRASRGGPRRGCPWGCTCPACSRPVRDITSPTDTCPGCIAWREHEGVRMVGQMRAEHITPVTAAQIYATAMHQAHARHERGDR